MARLEEFKGIEGTDFFAEDRGLQVILSELLKEEEREAVFASLHDCARLVSGPWNELAREANRAENMPRIIKYDRAGNSTEQIDFGPFTRQLRRQAAEFGILKEGRSNVHLFALVYLLAHNGEGGLNCGLSCTDGLIRIIEAHGSAFLRETYLPRLRSIETPFAGAQFVTERQGGSDVGAIETVARDKGDGTWAITGEKWFCSNPDEYFLVAARPADGPAGTAGVAIFFVPRVMPNGKLNHISFRRLKNKLGTQSLPTAEMDFNGAMGYLIGEARDGFKLLMSYVINVSRLHNAANACGFLHRAFLEARNYAHQRRAFGGALIDYPMIQETLVSMLEKLWRYRLLTFRLAAMIDERGLLPEDSEQAMWQRFLTNLAKYRTGATLTASIHDAIMVLGGNGIVEDFTVLPRLLRDAMIIETWEGPHNTLCLQIMRDAAKSNLIARWHTEISGVLERWPKDFLLKTRDQFETAFAETVTLLSPERLMNSAWAATHARRVVDRLGALLETVWLAEMARRQASTDATAAMLTSAAGCNLLSNQNPPDHLAPNELGHHATSLIEEESFRANVTAL
ncbi:MAG: acyl-CoA dehydrogenase family protein [Blastocatellia bacterium]